MSKDHFGSILRMMTLKHNGVKLPTTKILDIQSSLHLTITSYGSYLKTSYCTFIQNRARWSFAADYPMK